MQHRPDELAISNPLASVAKEEALKYNLHVFRKIHMALRSALRLGREDSLVNTHVLFLQFEHDPSQPPSSLWRRFKFKDANVIRIDLLIAAVRGTPKEGRFDVLTQESFAQRPGGSDASCRGASRTMVRWQIELKTHGRSHSESDKTLEFDLPYVVRPEHLNELEAASLAERRPNPRWLSQLRSQLQNAPKDDDPAAYVFGDLIASEGGRKAAEIIAKQSLMPRSSFRSSFFVLGGR